MIKNIHRNMAIVLVVAVLVVVALVATKALGIRDAFSDPQIVPVHYRDLPGLPRGQQRIRAYNPPHCTLSSSSDT